jgi:hypothetical protein
MDPNDFNMSMYHIAAWRVSVFLVMLPRAYSLISTSQLHCFGNLQTVEWKTTTYKVPSRKQSCQDMNESLFIIDFVYKIWVLFPTVLVSLIISS